MILVFKKFHFLNTFVSEDINMINYNSNIYLVRIYVYIVTL